MFQSRLPFISLAATLSVGAADPRAANRIAPAAGIAIAAPDRERLALGAAQLAKSIDSLRPLARSDARLRDLLPDVEIFHKAVDWALRYDEFFRSNEVAQAHVLLRVGTERVHELAAGRSSWLTSTGLVVRGYRSKIDGSVQPYGLVVPATFAGNTNRARRLDVWLHGRDDKLTELKFISDRLRSPGEFSPPDTLVLHPYGRFCNTFKFAGETDVFEALEHVEKFYPVDKGRLAIRGFSMGGAGVWHLAAHHPEVWAAAAPGAGFAETAEYTGALKKNPPPAWYEQKLWRLYDATDYALNLFNVPTIAYSGELDKQKQAADMMERAMKLEGLKLEHIIGPGVAHKYEPGAKKELARRFDELMEKGRDPWPSRTVLSTSTLRYNRSPRLSVEGLAKHWEPARVEADFTEPHSWGIRTTNVTRFTISSPPELLIASAQMLNVNLDGTSLKYQPVPAALDIHFMRERESWKIDADPRRSMPGRREKRPQLQGPIDDAFMESFAVVPPSKPAMNGQVGAWVDRELARFTNEWRAQFRGEAPVIGGTEEAAARAASLGANLILWGDPDSNPLLAKLLPRLPLSWTRKELRLGTNRFDAATHVPVLIFPNPLNPARYIVINSGPTFLDFGAASNAQQTPKLPDFAVLDVTVQHGEQLTKEVALAGFFDENWEWTDARGRVTP